MLINIFILINFYQNSRKSQKHFLNLKLQASVFLKVANGTYDSKDGFAIHRINNLFGDFFSHA